MLLLESFGWRMMYIYIKVRPANGSSSNTGNYKLTVGGNSGSISLTRYN